MQRSKENLTAYNFIKMIIGFCAFPANLENGIGYMSDLNLGTSKNLRLWLDPATVRSRLINSKSIWLTWTVQILTSIKSYCRKHKAQLNLHPLTSPKYWGIFRQMPPSSDCILLYRNKGLSRFGNEFGSLPLWKNDSTSIWFRKVRPMGVFCKPMPNPSKLSQHWLRISMDIFEQKTRLSSKGERGF